MSGLYYNGEIDYGRRNSISLSGFITEVENLIDNGKSDNYIGNLKEITTRHWKTVDSRSDCFNRQCRKQFTAVKERPHHCRRCGQLFCNSCVQFRRRLNKLAHFDPDGQLYKVCKKCFETDRSTDGQIRTHTKEFMYWRSQYRSRCEAASKIVPDFEKECDRLIRGFAASVGKSEIKRTLHEMRSMVSPPDWMKSYHWVRVNKADRCFACCETFGFLTSKKFCRICGQSVCKSCSSEDLLVFFPDDQSGKGLPKLAIIKIIGCPEEEPEISLYLRVCALCRDKMIDKQVKATEDEMTFDPEITFMDLLHRMNLKFEKTEEGVKRHMPIYSDVVESLEGSVSFSGTATQSNTKVLAKAQGDLADALVLHVNIVQQLKRLKPTSSTQTQLLKSYIRAKCDFYLDNMSLYRSLKEKLSKSIPTESLEFIQRFIDKNAISMTHLYVKQLVFELIHLTNKHKLNDDMPLFLLRVEEEVEAEVRQSLIQDKDNLDDHFKFVKEMLQDQIKKKKLLQPSKWMVRAQGSVYLNDYLSARSEEVLTQVMNQLQLKSASRSFARGKQALQVAKDGLQRKRQEDQGNEGFEMI